MDHGDPAALRPAALLPATVLKTADPLERRRRVLALALPILYAAAIFAQSSLPLPELPERTPRHLDKLLHLLEYGLLGFLVQRALAIGLLRPALPWALAGAVAALYGGTDELHQLFVPGRSASWGDFVADLVGGLGGAWLAHRLLSGRARRSRGAPAG